MIKQLLIVVVLASATMPVLAQQAPPDKLTSSGALFGVRESVQQIDISPDGKHIAYVAPGPGRSSAVYVADLATGTPQQVLQSVGNPHRLAWCNFVSNSRLICQLMGQINDAGLLVPFSRLIAVDTDGKNIKMLGQSSSHYDARARQFDGEVLDWLPDAEGAVLMARQYVPEEGNIGTRFVRNMDGLGVDRVDSSTLRSTPVEAPS